MKVEKSALDDLMIFLSGLSRMQGGGKSVAQFLLNKGQTFSAQALPDGYEMGWAKQCYANASMLVIADMSLRYVEGYVLSPKTGHFPVEHAWAVDTEGKVIDNTLKNTEANTYFGVSFGARDLHAWLMKAQVYGLFGGRTPRAWMAKVLEGKSLAMACTTKKAEIEVEAVEL